MQGIHMCSSTIHILTMRYRPTISATDGNVFYGDKEAWVKYAMGDNSQEVESDTTDIPSEENAVYRLYNPNDGQHMLTASHYEAVNLQNLGWTYEGIAFYAART